MQSISALMHTDVAAADKMMTLLSELLRMTLEKTGVQVTTLNCELEILDGYLAIEKVRFGDRLRVVKDFSPDTLGAQVPHLILQPLVENAVRHGVAKRSTEGEICIASWHDESCRIDREIFGVTGSPQFKRQTRAPRGQDWWPHPVCGDGRDRLGRSVGELRAPTLSQAHLFGAGGDHPLLGKT